MVYLSFNLEELVDNHDYRSTSWELTVTKPGSQIPYATDSIPGHTDRTVLLGNPILDRLVSTMMEMGAELWMQRRRLLALERALAQNGMPAAAMIEQAIADEAELVEERAQRDAMIDRIFGPLLAESQSGRDT